MKGSYTINSAPGNNIARRHRCEVCLEVFECHLCTIKQDHRMHSGQRLERIGNREGDPTMNVFVCEECVVADNSIYVRVGDNELKQGSSLNAWYWNYLTGERVQAKDIGRGLDRATRRKNHRKSFLHQ